MAFGNRDKTDNTDNSDEVMHEINMTPLVDVMLVLLIIFIITVPVMQHAVHIDLPRASHAPSISKPDTLRLSIDAQGRYFLNDMPVSDVALSPQLQAAAGQSPQPDLHIRGDKAVRYERVAQAMAAAQQAGLRKIGFITEPAH